MRFKDTDACKCLEAAWPAQMLSKTGTFSSSPPFLFTPPGCTVATQKRLGEWNRAKLKTSWAVLS